MSNKRRPGSGMGMKEMKGEMRKATQKEIG